MLLFFFKRGGSPLVSPLEGLWPPEKFPPLMIRTTVLTGTFLINNWKNYGIWSISFASQILQVTWWWLLELHDEWWVIEEDLGAIRTLLDLAAQNFLLNYSCQVKKTYVLAKRWIINSEFFMMNEYLWHISQDKEVPFVHLSSQLKFWDFELPWNLGIVVHLSHSTVYPKNFI